MGAAAVVDRGSEEISVDEFDTTPIDDHVLVRRRDQDGPAEMMSDADPHPVRLAPDKTSRKVETLPVGPGMQRTTAAR